MFCTHCGTPIPENEKACPKCSKAEPQTVAVMEKEAPQSAPAQEKTAFQMPQSPTEALELFKSTPLYIALAGCALMFISLFMPFATVTFFVKMNVSYISQDGKIALVLIIATGILMWKNKLKPAIATHALSVLLLLFSATQMSGSQDMSAFVSLSIGFYLYIIGAAIGAVGIFLTFKNQPSAE